MFTLLDLESSEIHSSTSEIVSLHRWSELFTRFFKESIRNCTHTNFTYTYIQCGLKKGNRDSILNLLKSERKKIMKLLSVEDSMFIFLLHSTLDQGWLLSISKLFSSKFLVCYTIQCGCMNFCFVVKAPANVVQCKQR